MRLARKVEINPTPTQLRGLRQATGNARWAYNWGLRKMKRQYDYWCAIGKPAGRSKENPSGFDWWSSISLHKQLNRLKDRLLDADGKPWLRAATKYAPQCGLQDVEYARKRWLSGRNEAPRFKSKRDAVGGFRIAGPVHVTERTVQLPRIGKVKIMPGCRGWIPPGSHGQASITQHAGRWYVSIVPKTEHPEPSSNGLPAAGLDMGIARLATLSDGTVIENHRAEIHARRRVLRAQRAMARRNGPIKGKRKASANWKKAANALRRARAREANIRKDALHKATHQLTNSHGKLVIEDLQIRNMMRSARGTLESPGTNVRAKRSLNRAMRNAALGEFRRQLEYKGRLYGCEIVAVAPHYSSQRCAACGHVAKDNRCSQSRFRCVSCGHKANADLNAARNLLVAGSHPETENACGDGSLEPSVKQETTKLTG